MEQADQLPAYRQPPSVQDVTLTLPPIVKAIAAPYQDHLAAGTGERPLGRRFVDDAKITDHHAIIPTTSSPENARLSSEERKIYDLVWS